MKALLSCRILFILAMPLLGAAFIDVVEAADEPQGTPAQSDDVVQHQQRAAERSDHGGDFRGTFAYDAQVGYDYGQADDNGRSAEHNPGIRGSSPRMPGKRPDPGDWDFFDPYYQGVLRNDGALGDYDDMGGYLEFHGYVGRDRYWRSQRFIPLRYDDFRQYQRFRYELGGSP